jgi:hypothetical protein
LPVDTGFVSLQYLPITLAESSLHPYLANPHSLVMAVLDSLSKLLPAGGLAGVRFSLAHSMLVLSRSPISQSTVHVPAAVQVRSSSLHVSRLIAAACLPPRLPLLLQALQMVLVHPDTGGSLRLRIVEDLLSALPLVDLSAVPSLAALIVSSLGSLPAGTTLPMLVCAER